MLLVAAAALATLPAMDSLREIQGEWIAQAANGRAVRADYRSISNDSALVETWRSASGRETMTVYFVDGGTLQATHYCAQGNQPTLSLAGAGFNRWEFRFVRATGVDPGEAVLTRLILERTNQGLRRTETYSLDGKDEVTVFEFVRPVATKVPKA